MSNHFLPIAEKTCAPKEGEDPPPAPRRPADDEVEIIVMGPGTGESILVHVGDGNWVIIDCFNIQIGEKKARRPGPAPTQYLREIGVNCEESVKGIVLTHPHRDHAAGLSKMFDECMSPTGEYPPLYVPGVLSESQWKNYFDSESKDTRTLTYHLEHAFNRASKNNKLVPVIRTSRLLGDLDCLQVISPTSKAVIKRGQADFKASDANPNLSSIVLWLEKGGTQALFGADMENHPEFGWEQILKETDISTNGQSTFVKIPHHGSDGSRHEQVYDLFKDSKGYIAAITRNNNPRGKLRQTLPDEETSKYHASNSLGTYKVGAQASTGVANAKCTVRTGWISARKKMDETEWEVQTYGTAVTLTPDVKVSNSRI